MLKACPREKEVNDLLASGRWPHFSGEELRNHVRGCSACSDLVNVAAAFHGARSETAAAMPQLGSPGALWWRAQLRRRNAAMERLNRPLLGAQIFALVITLLAAIGFFSFEAHHGIGWLDWLGELPQSASLLLPDLSPSALFGSAWYWLLAASAAALLLAAGVVALLATDKR
jgi:hypothetical protein